MNRTLIPQVIRFTAYEDTNAETGEKSIVMGAHPEGQWVSYEDYKTVLRELNRERYFSNNKNATLENPVAED